jgi:two-component system CheB/CheR fusion protein
VDDNTLSLLRDAFEDAPFEFWARDLEARCIVSNAVGRKLGDLVGRKVEDAPVAPEMISAWIANNQRAFAGQVVQNEFEYGDGDHKRYLQCYIVPLRIHGAIHGILGFNIDVTEHKRTEEELRAVDRRRGEFLGVLSHELRNPLAVIGSSLRCIDRGALADDATRRAVAAIERQSNQLARLVDDLLDITRISSGKISLQRRRIDLAQLVSQTVDDHRALLAARTVTVTVPPEPVWMHGDPTRLAQIVGNLLSNAAKFTPSGGTIAISLSVAAQRAVLEVCDTGVGIDEETLRELFAPFVQAERSVDRSRAGLGLGLALVKTLVEMHGGEVTVRSAGPGEGATFTIAVPLGDAPAQAPRRWPRGTGAPRKVLVIEDNKDVAEWLAEALALAGHQVTITLDGEQGLAKARELDPDVILCDIGLPGSLDGYAVARALQGDPALATAYRVALTGYAQPEDQRRAREAGFEAHLSKPPDLDALEQILAEMPRGVVRRGGA